MIFKREIKKIKFLNMEIPEPRVLLDFLGFEKHVMQIRDKRGAQIWPGWYDHAAYYIVDLPPEKLYANQEKVLIPSLVKAGDYEFEIACIIGKTALISDFNEALTFFRDHCFLTILNDWSARDIQKKDIEGLGPNNSKSVIGKSFGPQLIPVSHFRLDENGVMDIEMILTVNGQERSRSNYNTIYHTHPVTKAKQCWSFPRIISWLGQQNITVHAGYFLGSGTVGNGCIAEFAAKIDPKSGQELQPASYPWLAEGDTVVMEALGIGILENKVGVASPQYAQVR